MGLDDSDGLVGGEIVEAVYPSAPVGKSTRNPPNRIGWFSKIFSETRCFLDRIHRISRMNRISPETNPVILKILLILSKRYGRYFGN